jgi:hypothetical protein
VQNLSLAAPLAPNFDGSDNLVQRTLAGWYHKISASLA